MARDREARERQEQEHRSATQRQARLKSTAPETPRRLRGLIRLRYQLDAAIWSKRTIHCNSLKVGVDLDLTE